MTNAETFQDMVNPARAGMIRNLVCIGCRIHSKPRASGDDPVRVAFSSMPTR